MGTWPVKEYDNSNISLAINVAMNRPEDNSPLLTIDQIKSKKRSHHIKYGGQINSILEGWVDKCWLQSTLSVLAMVILFIMF